MANSDEIVEQFRDELRRILMTERQSLKDRIALVRTQFMETMARLENEVDATSTPLAEQLERQFLQSIHPLLSIPEEFAQQQAALNGQIAGLSEELQRRDEENLRLRNENEQLEEQTARTADDLSKMEEMIHRLTQERQQLDQHVASVVEEYAQAKANAGQAIRSLWQRRLAAMDRIEGKKSQVDILTAFLEEAAQFAGRVALFVSKEGMFSGWRSQGFSSPAFSDSDIKSVHFSVQGESLLRHAYENKRSLEANRHSHPENGLVLDRLGAPAKDSIMAIPLVVKEKSTAVLYADGGANPEGSYNGEALELLVRHVALSIELLAYRARSVIPPRPPIRPATPPVVERPTATPPAAVAAEQIPRAPAFTPPAVISAPSFEPAAPPPVQTSAPASEYLQEPPSERVEVVTHVSPMESMSEPVRPSRAEYPPIQEMPTPPAGGEQDLKLHNDAKRFARLLVSEIKLYNEQKVLAGRKNRDIYDRLKEDIDRSREMYMKRVSPIVSNVVDYFYDELVRTLGDNDPDALGSDCPGPMIGAAAE